MLADARQLFTLKCLLRTFSNSTRLHVNFQKSFLVSINVSARKSSLLTQTFGCEVGSMPFTYLGLPLGTTRPTVQEFSPLLTKIERRLSGVSKFLSYQERLIMVNSIFSALPTYYMCSIVMPPTVIQQIDRFRKHFLRSKGDISRRGTCLAAWEPSCRPKDEGGLGIIDMKNQNITLLMKFLDNFYNHADIPWVKLTWSKLYQNTNIPPHERSPTGSFWWKDIIKLFEKFKAFAICHPNPGNSVAFWKDNWSGQILGNKYPHLFSYALKANCLLQFYCNNQTNRCFFLPL